MLATDAKVGVVPLTRIPESMVREIVEVVMCDPYIKRRVAHDHREPGYISHPDVRYLGALVDGKIAGVFTLIDFSELEVEIHAALLPRYIRQSRQLGAACLDHVFSDSAVQRATAYIIEGLESARNYCLHLGFTQEGMRRNACLKDGRLVGVHVLGITRADWEKMK